MEIGNKKLKNKCYRILTHIFFDADRKITKRFIWHQKRMLEANIVLEEIKSRQRKLEIEQINNLKTSEEILKYIAIEKVNEIYK